MDFLIGLPVDFPRAWEHRHELALEGVCLPVLALDDLIALKEASNREQDRADRDALLRLKGSHGEP